MTFSDMLDLAPSSNSSQNNKIILAFDKYALQLQDIGPKLFNGQSFSVNLESV